MEEKKKSPIIQDEEITSIEAEFNVIFNELSEFSSISEYGSVFRKLRSILIDSHQKNQDLSKVVQDMNQKIIANATRVQTLLKMSEKDTEEIEKYKCDFEKVFGLVSVSQCKEVRAKELCDSLKSKVNQLSKMVAEQSVNEDSLRQLNLDILNYDNETKSRADEIEQIKTDIESFKKQIEAEIESKNNAILTIRSLEESITLESQQNSRLQMNKDSYTNEINDAKRESASFNEHVEFNISEIQKMKKQLWKLRQAMQNQRSVENEYKIEYEATSRSLQNKVYKKDQVLNRNLDLETKIHFTQVNFERAKQDFDCLMNEKTQLEKVMEEHQNELTEILQKDDQIHAEIVKLQQKKREYGLAIVNINRLLGFTDSTNRAAVREADYKSRMLQNMEVQIDEAANVTDQEKSMTNMVKSNISTKKHEIQTQDFQSTNLEKQTVTLIERTTGVNIQLIRFEDNEKLIQVEKDNAEETLKHLTKSLEDNDKLNRQTQMERDQIANRIVVVDRDNERLLAQYNEKAKAVDDMRKKIDQRTEAIISTHFQTRGLEKQIQSLGVVLNITNNLCLQASATIVGYKSEGQKLRLILEEAKKDINSAKGELFNITGIIKLIRGQLATKRDVSESDTQKAITLTHELRIKQAAAKNQAMEMNVLNQELEYAVSRYQDLSQMASRTKKLKIVSIRLEAQVRNETEFGNACVREFKRPTNVHRWTIMEMMQPEQYKRLQLIEFLKTKIEEVKREQIKLDDQKSSLQKQIQTNRSKVRGCKITDGSNAAHVYKTAIEKKDKQIDNMKEEIDLSIKQRQEVIEGISILRNKLKQGYIMTSTLRKQNQQQFPVPKLHTVTGLDKTRLGGGFSITPDKQKVTTIPFFLTEGKTDENEPTTPRSHMSSRPVSQMSAFKPINNMPDKQSGAYSQLENIPKINSKKSKSEMDKTSRRQKTIFTGNKIVVKKQDDAKNATKIEFKNSQLSSRRTNEDSKNSSRPPSRVNNNETSNTQKSSWRPQSVIKPSIGPYFGPL